MKPDVYLSHCDIQQPVLFLSIPTGCCVPWPEGLSLLQAPAPTSKTYKSSFATHDASMHVHMWLHAQYALSLAMCDNLWVAVDAKGVPICTCASPFNKTHKATFEPSRGTYIVCIILKAVSMLCNGKTLSSHLWCTPQCQHEGNGFRAVSSPTVEGCMPPNCMSIQQLERRGKYKAVQPCAAARCTTTVH